MPDRLVVVNGMAGAGKTTLAGPLARQLSAPLVGKDALKEAIADAVDVSLPTRSLGALASDALWRVAGMLPGTVLIESVWLAGRDESWFAKGWESVGSPTGVELWCEAPSEIMRERFLNRHRHSAHDDDARTQEWDAAALVARPITGFPVIRVDTSATVDVVRLGEKVLSVLG